MANVTVEFNRKTQTFKLQGMNALGHSSLQKVTSLTMAELMQVSKLLSDGVFQFMIDNNIAIKEVATFHHTHVAEFFGQREPDTVVTSTVSSSAKIIESPPRTPSPTSSIDSGSSSGGSTSSAKSLYQMYVKKIKSENPDLTHKQAQAKASETYQEWKKTQV